MNGQFELLNGDCTDLLSQCIERIEYKGLVPVVVTDPPFNVGYHYRSYSDKMNESEYYAWLCELTSLTASVVVHYPEALHRLSIEKHETPERVVSWVYPSNTKRQHRDIAYYGIKPDFRRVTQPFRDPNDKRNRAKVAAGIDARSYDWCEVNQVKNISKEKTEHPCQMPEEVMRRVVGVLPDGIGVIDPFCGSGTTGVACARLGIPFFGIELDERYYEIACERLDRETCQGTLF